MPAGGWRSKSYYTAILPYCQTVLYCHMIWLLAVWACLVYTFVPPMTTLAFPCGGRATAVRMHMDRARAERFSCCPEGGPNDLVPMWRLVWSVPAFAPSHTFHDDATFFTGCRVCGWNFGRSIGFDSSGINPPLLGVTHNWPDFDTAHEYPLDDGDKPDDKDDDDDDDKPDDKDERGAKRPRTEEESEGPRTEEESDGGAAWRASAASSKA